MGEHFHINLFGTFNIRYRDKPVDKMNSPRLQELLAYLVIHRNAPQQRQQIALHFWPDNPEKQTLGNVRQLLYQLRTALPQSDLCISSDTTTIQWNTDAPCTVDLVEFEKLQEKAENSRRETDTTAEIDFLEQAIELYRGPLLPHCYEEWTTGKRNQLHETYTDQLRRLCELLEKERRYEPAIKYAGKLMDLDPCDEAACRLLMRLHALNEDRAAVIRTYRSCGEQLRKELDIEPGPKTRDLFKRLSKSGKEDSAESMPSYRPPAGNGSDTSLPLINRREEWTLLLDTWEQAKSGNMQCVLIRGEPGIGKSRLANELLAHLSRQGYDGAWARCQEAPQTPGYGPFADWLRSPSFSSRISELDTIWKKELARLLPEYSKHPLDDPEREPWEQRRFEEALARAFVSSGKPGLLLIDEIQWCDPETLGWINFLNHRNEPVPLLFVASLRPSSGTSEPNDILESLVSDLRRNRRLHKIELDPLDKSGTLKLASRILDREINPVMGNLLYRETEGNPLFIVEMAREIHQLELLKKRENGDFVPPDQTPSRIRTLPRGISDVISGRFRHLSREGREVLGIASVAGRGFSFEILNKICHIEENELLDILDDLIDLNIVREPEPEFYDFTHDKLREVAYKELSETRKRRLHKQVASTLLEIHEADLEPYHGKLAFHYDRAGMTESAIDHYRKGALHARKVTSRQDVGMLRRALELLDQLSDNDNRKSLELDLTTSLVESILSRRNLDTEEVFSLCERVYRLSSQLGKPPPMTILFTLSITNLLSGDPSTANELAIVMESLARELVDRDGRVESCYLRGISNRVSGNIGKAAGYYKQGLDLYEKGLRLPHMQIYNLDGSIILLMEAAACIMLNGYENEARNLMEKARKTAVEAQFPFADAYISFATAWIETLCRNVEKAQASIEQFFKAGIDINPMYVQLQAEIINGWVKAVNGYPEHGIGKINGALTRLEENGYTLDLAYYYCLLAEVLIAEEELGEAESKINIAEELMEETGSYFSEPEILRLKGELYRSQNKGDKKKAEEYLNKSVDTAREQDNHIFMDFSRKELGPIH